MARIQFEDMLRNYQAQMNAAIEECIQQKIPIRKIAEGFIRFGVNTQFASYLNSIARGKMALIEYLTEEEIKAHQRGISDALFTALILRLDEIVDELTDEDLGSGNPDTEDSKA